MYYVYLIVNERGDKYIGYTSDLKDRLNRHNKGEVRSTRGHEWKLVYYEAYRSKSDAIRREKALKDGRAKYWLMERVRESVSLVLK